MPGLLVFRHSLGLRQKGTLLSGRALPRKLLILKGPEPRKRAGEKSTATRRPVLRQGSSPAWAETRNGFRERRLRRE